MLKNKIEKLFSANPIKGNFCHFYQIGLEDADLIYDLRTNREDSFLKHTGGTVEDQRNYIKSYFERFEKREEIYYKLLDVKTQKFSGILRLTEIEKNDVFNWQSFVVSKDTSPNAPIDAMLMVYRIGFELLERQVCGPWLVDKNFAKMIKIHNLVNMAKIVGEEELYHYFSVKKEDYLKNINRFLKMGYGNLQGLL